MADGPLVIIVASAADRNDDESNLRWLKAERDAIRRSLSEAGRQGVCLLEIRADATLDDIVELFQEHRDRVAAFHFAGHADSYRLMLASRAGRPHGVGGQGFAEFLGSQLSLRLVFLNGCSTYGHIEALHRAGVPAVVATAQSVRDDIASAFAGRFYAALGTGASIDLAFHEAASAGRAAAGDDHRNASGNRALGGNQKDIGREGWPWDLKVAPGAEAELDWSLGEAANDPLFGIPDPPLADLPEAPYLGLRHYTAAHTEVFFGRGKEIRSLYKWVRGGRATTPILLLHGQSGVGKSSLLEAGLIPRLIGSDLTRLLRRSPTSGLVGTLAEALDALPGADFRQSWKDLEHERGRPLVVVVDQLEEAFTQPLEDQPEELTDFLRSLQQIFRDREARPRGKLILGFRKEFFPEIEELMKEARLYHTNQFVEPLSRTGIIEAIEGPAKHPRLLRHYGLTIAPPAEGEEPLPEAIADDLRSDRDAPIGPTLQVLLEKMWGSLGSGPSLQFDERLYREVARPARGGILDAFLDEQLHALAGSWPQLAGTGLFIDVLAFHTTQLGTSRSRSWEELSSAYAHHSSRLQDLVEELKRLRLLTGESRIGTSGRSTRLSHDTLAPLVRRRADDSPDPGPRARRILEQWSRRRDHGGSSTILEEEDMRAVDNGVSGTRTLTPDELDAIERSRRIHRIPSVLRTYPDRVAAALLIAEVGEDLPARMRAEALRHIHQTPLPLARWSAQRGLVAHVCFNRDGTLIACACTDGTVRVGTAGTHRFVTELEAHGPEALTAQFSPDSSRLVVGYGDGSVRVWTIAHAVSAAVDGDGRSESAPRSTIVLAAPVVLEGHTGVVESARFSPDGLRVVTASRDGTARLWRADGEGEALVMGEHSNVVEYAEFSPAGDWVVSASRDHTARLWPADLSSVGHPIRAHDGRVHMARFSPDGQHIATASADGTAHFAMVRETRGVAQVLRTDEAVGDLAFSPDGQRLVTAGANGSLYLWDVGFPYEIRSVEVRGLAGDAVRTRFTPDGKHIVAVSDGGAVRVWYVGEQSRSQPLAIAGFETGTTFFEAAISADCRRVATASTDGEVTTWGTWREEPLVLSHDATALPLVGVDEQGRCSEALVQTGAGEVVVRRSGVAGQARVNANWHRSECCPGLRPDSAMLAWLADEGLLGELTWEHTREKRSRQVRFSPDGKRVMRAQEDGSVDVEPVDRQGPRVRLDIGDGALPSAMFNHDGSRVLAVDDGFVRIWRTDREDGPVVLDGYGEGFHSATFSPNGTQVVAATEQTMHVWFLERDYESVALPGHSGKPIKLEFSADGQRLCAVYRVSESGTGPAWDVIRVWSTDAPSSPVVLGELPGYLQFEAFSPTGIHVLMGGKGASREVWEVGGSNEKLLVGNRYSPLSARFNFAGDRVVASFRDGTASVWSLAGNDRPVVLRGHDAEVLDASFSPDDQRIITASKDGTARVWSADGAGEPLVLSGHDGGATEARFTVDGEWGLTLDSTGAARMWRLGWSRIVEYIASATTICLTAAQRRELLGESREESVERYRACERGHGREPGPS